MCCRHWDLPGPRQGRHIRSQAASQCSGEGKTDACPKTCPQQEHQESASGSPEIAPARSHSRRRSAPCQARRGNGASLGRLSWRSCQAGSPCSMETRNITLKVNQPVGAIDPSMGEMHRSVKRGACPDCALRAAPGRNAEMILELFHANGLEYSLLVVERRYRAEALTVLCNSRAPGARCFLAMQDAMARLLL